MPETVQNTKAVDTTANPAPLGLMGFALTTILLNLHNVGLFPLDSMIMGMGIFYGGLAQLFVGIMEWKKNNTFGTLAFTSYGAFWISLVAVWILPKLGLAEGASAVSMGWYLTVWGVFSLGLFIGTLKTTKALSFVFGTLVLLFAFLAIKDFTGSHTMGTVAGITGIICGASAFYTSIAQVLNEMYGRTVMPLCPWGK
jgi:succinate-acetate transporter protein